MKNPHEILKSQSFYKFFDNDDNVYGTLSVNLITHEIELVDTINENKINFAFPRACRAIKKALKEKGSVPDKLCYAA